MFSNILDYLYKFHQCLFAQKDTKCNFRNGRKFFFTNMILISLFSYLYISLFWLKANSLSIVIPVLGAIVSIAGLYFKANVDAKEVVTKAKDDQGQGQAQAGDVD